MNVEELWRREVGESQKERWLSSRRMVFQAHRWHATCTYALRRKNDFGNEGRKN